VPNFGMAFAISLQKIMIKIGKNLKIFKKNINCYKIAKIRKKTLLF